LFTLFDQVFCFISQPPERLSLRSGDRSDVVGILHRGLIVRVVDWRMLGGVVKGPIDLRHIGVEYRPQSESISTEPLSDRADRLGEVIA
jgi:hypothetical protein